jgi:hypothetical protein
MEASKDRSGVFEDVHGFGGCAQMVGYATIGGEECEAAARAVAAEEEEGEE